jgi:hypothetical protein
MSTVNIGDRYHIKVVAIRLSNDRVLGNVITSLSEDGTERVVNMVEMPDYDKVDVVSGYLTEGE